MANSLTTAASLATAEGSGGVLREQDRQTVEHCPQTEFEDPEPAPHPKPLEEIALVIGAAFDKL